MIVGKHVTLRAVTPEDYPRMTEFRNDIEVALLAGGDAPRPQTLAAVSELLHGLSQDKENFGFAIESDGTLIGDCGLFHVARVSGTAEAGIGIGDRNYWDKGFGREAMGLLIDFGFRIQNLRKIWLTVHGSNLRAVRSYQSVGFVEEGRQRAQVWSGGQYLDLVHMGLFRDAWHGFPARASAPIGLAGPPM